MHDFFPSSPCQAKKKESVTLLSEVAAWIIGGHGKDCWVCNAFASGLVEKNAKEEKEEMLNGTVLPFKSQMVQVRNYTTHLQYVQ